ncbi:MAG: sarcosine oxidase/L-pipecolate oxidase [Rhodothermales bacterium]|jgi:sarcosine oxidase/L-pipecolate oxidase
MHEKPGSCCVIGGGVIGSWAALHLLEAGVPTTLIEQFPLPHSRGSSHGGSRAFRFLGDDPLARLEYSMDRWQALEAQEPEGARRLFVQTGLLNFGPAGDPYLDKYISVVRRGGRVVDWLEADEIAQQFPGTVYPLEWGAAWDPGGGMLLAGKCVAAIQARFLAMGGHLLNASVMSVTDEGADVEVEVRSPSASAPEFLRFGKAIACAGPWTAKLFPTLTSVLKTVKIPVTYWDDPTDTYSAAKGFPILFNARLADVYGFPSYEYPGLVKILVHDGAETHPDSRDLADLQPYIDTASAYVREHLPLLVSDRPAILEPCMYTVTPDESPIMDRLTPNVVVGCGYSGSGFKHSPASGHLLAAMAMGRENTLPAGFNSEDFALARFAGLGD